MPALYINNTWQQTPETLRLSKDYIDVWLYDLRKLSSNTKQFYVLLSNDEQARADKLKIENKQQQYIITRGALRQRLATLTHGNPEDFIFKTLEYGKPVLNNNPDFKDLQFNVSHSYNFALIAVSLTNNMGVDIEKISNDSDHQALVTRFFSEIEQTEFQTIADINKVKAFYACWTRKEAFIKAIGDGITYRLNSFDVTIDPEIQISKINPHEPISEIWYAQDLPVNNDYIACVVSNISDIKVRCWQ